MNDLFRIHRLNWIPFPRGADEYHMRCALHDLWMRFESPDGNWTSHFKAVGEGWGLFFTRTGSNQEPSMQESICVSRPDEEGPYIFTLRCLDRGLEKSATLEVHPDFTRYRLLNPITKQLFNTVDVYYDHMIAEKMLGLSTSLAAKMLRTHPPMENPPLVYLHSQGFRIAPVHCILHWVLKREDDDTQQILEFYRAKGYPYLVNDHGFGIL